MKKNYSSVEKIVSLLFPLIFISIQLQAQQKNDPVYGAKIKEYTTDVRFLNELVDHLPASNKIPSPLDHFGTIIGAPDILHYVDEIYGYLEVLAEASPRVVFRNIGKTEEDRDMVEVIVSSKQNIKNLETYRTYLNQLSDPRKISEQQAQDIISKAKPIYYATGGLHSTETGAPEMLMELAYRLAVEESDYIKTIRENVIFIFSPIAEPDGRDRVVDIYKYRAKNNGIGPGLTYWGHYVAHDNNRDALGMGLALSRNFMKTYLHWQPQVMHDLHESVPYLYISTGKGPYNTEVDAITIDEWHNLAHEEVSELTRRNMPGVWTHNFYNGWAANYLSWMANIRNSIGRFYEVFGNSMPFTVERTLTNRSTSTQWYRPNPPLDTTQWSLRNNTNYGQSGVLVALNYTARNREKFVSNFYVKSKRSIEKGKTKAPHAWLISPNQKRPIATANLMNLLLDHGVEVHKASDKTSWGEDTVKAGTYIVRMDQPYRAVIQNLLGEQKFPANLDPPYDDTGWTMSYLRNVETSHVSDPAILEADMELVSEHVSMEGDLKENGSAYYLLNHNTEDNIAVLRFKLENVKVLAAEDTFSIGEELYKSGSFIIPTDGNPSNLKEQLSKHAQELGLTLIGVGDKPEVETHEVEIPRVALVHTWVATPQDAGWWRMGFDKIGIPYTYLAEQDLATEDLSKYDVIILPNSRANPQTLVEGRSRVGAPTPWKQTEEYKHIGIIDETDDTRKGMGYEGLGNLKKFIESGGVFITEGATSAFPIDMGITRRISISQPSGLVIRGSVLKSSIKDRKSPIVYGYDEGFPIYFSRGPVFQISKNLGDARTPEWLKEQTWEAEVPRVVLSFAKNDLLMSGMLRGEKNLTDKPAVVDVPVGQGHVVLFANRPFWRWETHGSHALVFNTMLHWNDLRAGWPERPE